MSFHNPTFHLAGDEKIYVPEFPESTYINVATRKVFEGTKRLFKVLVGT